MQVVAQQGPAALNLRAIAADLGVSHTAPRHHFGNRQGVLTAIAVDGFTLLGARLAALREAGAPFVELGVAYVEFATEQPAHFSVMFTPSLLDTEDPTFVEAADVAFAELRAGVEALGAHGSDSSHDSHGPHDSHGSHDPKESAAAAVIAAWSLAHGLADLALTGNLDRAGVRDLVASGDLPAITRRAAGLLFGSSPRGSDR